MQSRVQDWKPVVDKVHGEFKAAYGDSFKMDKALIYAFIDLESSGDENTYMPPPGAKTYQKNVVGKGLVTFDLVKGGRGLIVGAYQGSTNWFNSKAGKYLKLKLTPIQYFDRIRNNRELQTRDFLRAMYEDRKQHRWRPDLMSIQHSRCGGGGCFRRNSRDPGALLKYATEEQYQQFVNGQVVTGDKTAMARAAAQWYQKSRGENGLMYKYAMWIQQRHKDYVQFTGEPDPSDQYLLDWQEYKYLLKEAIHGCQQQSITAPSSSEDTEHMPFVSGRFITPEETRKGIIAQVYNINEWYLATLNDPGAAKDKASATDSVLDEGAKLLGYSDWKQAKEDFKAKIKYDPDSDSKKPGLRADLSLDLRRRYVQSLVEAEFHRRRFDSRSVPPISGPFNPYPVSGFPCLIMNPIRPILGYISAVTHNINVGSANGSTSVTVRFPRYWDEGEVWYWLGGEEIEDSSCLTRSFPQWHNRLVVPTNNYDIDIATRLKVNSLDQFYDFMIGCYSVEYQSNHSKIEVDAQTILDCVKNRKPGPFEISPETLELREYNAAIASTDDEGRFKRGTLAYDIYGAVRPSKDNMPTVPIEDVEEYNERYGISERELLEDFLENRIGQLDNGIVVVYGPTFGNTKTEQGNRHLNQIQQGIVDYIEELETRTLEGGV